MVIPVTSTRDWQTRLRLWAALILGVYQFLHLGYYAAGLISPDAMEAFGKVLDFAWPLTYLFLVALLVHMPLGLWKLYRRNTLRMPFWEIAQISLGMLLAFSLVPNILDNLSLSLVFGITPNYVDSILLTFPEAAWRYIVLAFVVGAHGQIGAHAVLRMRPWYPRARVPIAVVLTLLPLAAAAGYLNGGSVLLHAYLSGQMPADDLPHILTAAQQAFLGTLNLWISLFFAVLYLFIFCARGARLWILRSHRTVSVRYASGAQVMVLPATTILEASRIGNVPHASICGGRGRCTTCRVRIEGGAENISPVGDRELKALVRIGAPEGVRLACQTECLRGEVKITPLLPVDVRSHDARLETKNSIGRDVEMAVMFVDLRGFTRLSEMKFPYDVVYILNSYFQDMGKVIESNRGKVDKFLGDGILAYFGLDEDPRSACMAAIETARGMANKLIEINAKLESVLPQGLSLGIGLHFGELVLGEVGFQSSRQLTIIGDTVNTASRLESINKKFGTQMTLTSVVAAHAGIDLSALPMGRTTLRGKTEELRVYMIKDILKDLPQQLR